MEIIGHSEQLLRSSFTGEEYDSLLRFFQDIWASDADYKIFMARRAFNLNFAFMDVMTAQYKDEYQTESILSNTALLLCAEEIAEYYRKTESFPKILILDDLLIHGRGIMKLVSNLENLIVDFLKDDRANDLSRKMIHEKLLRAINVYVFAKNTGGILLDPRLSIRSAIQLQTSGLKSLSQKISRALQLCGIPNTSYVLSAELPWSFRQRDYDDGAALDMTRYFQYRGNKLRFYYRSRQDKVLETVRGYYSEKKNVLKPMCTSLVIFGTIPYEQNNPNSPFHTLCKKAAREIRQIIPYSRIADILSYEQYELTRPRAQMLSYLLSIFSYANFFQEKISSNPQLVYKALLRSDYQKVITNFDRPQKIKFEIIQLFSYISQNNTLAERVFEALEANVSSLSVVCGSGESCERKWQPASSFNARNLQSDALHELTEDIFYEVGMNAENDANQYVQTQLPFDPAKPGKDFICLNKYLLLMQQREIGSLPSIGCALSLMDSGLLALNVALSDSQNSVQCILKAGELSTFVLPRRFSVLIPALSIVEQNYEKLGSSIQNVIIQFVEYLQDHCYSENGKVSSTDVSLLRKLRQSMLYLLYMYRAGQSFQDWDIDLLTNEDRYFYGMNEQGNFNLEKYLSWILNEAKRIRYYKYCARTFLRYGNKNP